MAKKSSPKQKKAQAKKQAVESVGNVEKCARERQMIARMRQGLNEWRTARNSLEKILRECLANLTEGNVLDTKMRSAVTNGIVAENKQQESFLASNDQLADIKNLSEAQEHIAALEKTVHAVDHADELAAILQKFAAVKGGGQGQILSLLGKRADKLLHERENMSAEEFFDSGCNYIILYDLIEQKRAWQEDDLRLVDDFGSACMVAVINGQISFDGKRRQIPTTVTLDENEKITKKSTPSKETKETSNDAVEITLFDTIDKEAAPTTDKEQAHWTSVGKKSAKTVAEAREAIGKNSSLRERAKSIANAAKENELVKKKLELATLLSMDTPERQKEEERIEQAGIMPITLDATQIHTEKQPWKKPNQSSFINKLYESVHISDARIRDWLAIIYSHEAFTVDTLLSKNKVSSDTPRRFVSKAHGSVQIMLNLLWKNGIIVKATYKNHLFYMITDEGREFLKRPKIYNSFASTLKSKNINKSDTDWTKLTDATRRQTAMVRSYFLGEIVNPLVELPDFDVVKMELSGIDNTAVVYLNDDFDNKYVYRFSTLLIEGDDWQKQVANMKSVSIVETAATEAVSCVDTAYILIVESEDEAKVWLEYMRDWPMHALAYILPPPKEAETGDETERQYGYLLDGNGEKFETLDYFVEQVDDNVPAPTAEELKRKDIVNTQMAKEQKNAAAKKHADKKTKTDKQETKTAVDEKQTAPPSQEEQNPPDDTRKNSALAELALKDAENTSAKLAAQLADGEKKSLAVAAQQIADDLSLAADSFERGFASTGMLWLHSLKDTAQSVPRLTEIADEAGYILDDPLTVPRLIAVDTFNFWDCPTDDFIEGISVGFGGHYLNLAALTKNFYAPRDVHSYQLVNRWNQLNEDRANEALKKHPAIKQLIELFRQVADSSRISFAEQLSFGSDETKDDMERVEKALHEQTEHIKAAVNVNISNVQIKNMADKLYRANGLITPYFVGAKEKSLDELKKFCQRFSDWNFDDPSLALPNMPETGTINPQKLGDFLDSVWDSCATHARKSQKFTGSARNGQMNLLSKALTVLCRYCLCRKKAAEPKRRAANFLAATDRNKCLELIAQLKESLAKDKPQLPFERIGKNIFVRLLENIEADTAGQPRRPFYAACLLGEEYIELDENLIPQTENFTVMEFSLRERLIPHTKSILSLPDIPSATQAALKSSLSRHDLGQARLLTEFYGDALNITAEDINKQLRNGEKLMGHDFDNAVRNFHGDLELAYDYGRITDKSRKDYYGNASDIARRHFEKSGNLGIYRSFLEACRQGIDRLSLSHRLQLLNRYKELAHHLNKRLDEERGNSENNAEFLEEHEKKKNDLLRLVKQQIDLGNLSVAEDYINRSYSDGYSTLDIIPMKNEELSVFLEDYYQKYYDICTRQRAKSMALNNIYSQMESRSAHNRLKKDAAAFIDCWRDLKNTANIKALLTHLSYPEADNITVSKGGDVNIFKVTFKDDGRQHQKYAHPFAAFGTDCRVYGLEVIVMTGNRSASGIAEALKQAIDTFNGGRICIADCALALAERRKLAQLMKTGPDFKNIVVLDRVLALYLTQYEDNVRGERFLRLAIPFAQVQPYTASTAVPPEMFVGREREMHDIMDMRGSVLVYGGRQLGKSALLQQTRSLMHRPAANKYALLVTLKGCDAASALEKIGHELVKTKLLKNAPTSWDELYHEIDFLMADDVDGKPIEQLMLLLDEADNFLDSAAAQNNRPVELLKELMDNHIGRFKFILAGLHRVIYFGNNTVFGQLGHITIRPFTCTEAYELLIKPMSYMGFELGNPVIASLIFARANYFPGLIQYYCKMIVDAAGDTYKQNKFNSVNNPPYILDDEYLKGMMNDGDFQQEINRKFQITLELGTDNYYDIIALALAERCHLEGTNQPATPNDIREVCTMFDIAKITDLSDERLSSLMGEMAELNILRPVPGKTKEQYEFNRYIFYSMMGSAEEVEEKLGKYGKETGNND